MKTKEIIKKEYKRSQVIAKKLLSSPSYKDDFDKFKKATTILTRGLREELIKDKYLIAEPYDFETLNLTFRGESVLAPEVFKVVNVVKREKGYIYVKIKIDEPRDRILYVVKKTLEMEQERLPESKKIRFRGEKLKALEVWEEWLRLGLSGKKGFPQITKKFNIPLSTVKTRWYKAYTLLYGKPYKPQKIKEELRDKADKLCSQCKDAKCYKIMSGSMKQIPCPAYIKLTGKGYQRDKTITDKQVRYIHFGETDTQEG